MMFRVAVVLGLIAVCVAKEQCCSYGDRKIVQKQWGQLWREAQSSRLKILFGRRVLLKVVELNPTAKDLFKNVGVDNPEGGEFSAHAMRIMNAIDMSINLLSDNDALEEALDHLADQHQVRAGVKKEYFKTFAEVFLKRALPKVLDNMDGLAWKACFKNIFGTIAGKLQA